MGEFTIIIPTHNRPEYLGRILDYYCGYNVACKIIVADSSSGENKKKNERKIASTVGLEISHLDHYPCEVSLWHKLASALDGVGTEYFLFCADDDFVVPAAIEKSIDFLKKNKDFSVAQGQTAVFYPMVVKKRGDFYWRVDYLLESNVLSAAEDRMVRHLANYSVPTFYGVHRTRSFKRIFKEVLASVSHGRFIEILLEALTLIDGKMKCFDSFYSAREIIFDSAGIMNGRISDLEGKNGKEWYEKEMFGFKRCLVSNLTDRSGLSSEEAGLKASEAISSFLKNDGPGIYRRFLMGILGFFPGQVSKKVQSVYREAKLKVSKPDEELLKLVRGPLSEYYADFVRIRDCVVSHREIYKN